MRLLAMAAILACLVPFVSLTARTVEAKGGFGLSIEPEELEWGQSVRLAGVYWPEGEVEVSARFSATRLRPDRFNVPAIAPGDFSFEDVILFEDVSGLPGQPAPGWIEVTVRMDEAEVSLSRVVTVDGQRPPDSSYVSGRVHNRPAQPSSFVIVWSPVDDPAGYAFTWTTESGDYQTRYLPAGEWFIGLYDLAEEWHAADDDLQAVAGYSKELNKDVTLTGRVVTVRPGQAHTDIDFTLAPGSAPAEDAIRVDAAEAPASVASVQPSFTPSGSSKGWLGPTLLGVGAGLMLAFVATTRWAERRPR